VSKRFPACPFDHALKNGGPILAGEGFAKFEERPLSSRLMEYAAQDARVLFDVYEGYTRMIRNNVEGRVVEESRRRVAMVQSLSYNPNSRANMEAPRFW
jgi:ribonuclease D